MKTALYKCKNCGFAFIGEDGPNAFCTSCGGTELAIGNDDDYQECLERNARYDLVEASQE